MGKRLEGVVTDTSRQRDPLQYVLVCTVLGTLGLQGEALAEVVRLVDNSSVLAQWAQATGSPAPTVTTQADGSAKLDWTHGLSFDLKHVSSTGSNAQTPNRSGTFGTVTFSTEYRHAEDGGQTWFTFAAQTGNDRAKSSNTVLVNTLQGGMAGRSFRFAYGDVPANFSTLGTNASMKGVFGERLFEGRTLVSGAAGIVGTSWAALADSEKRQQYLRDAYAMRVQHKASESWGLYASNQRYADEVTSLSRSTAAAGAVTTTLAPAKGNASTVGTDWKAGALTVNAEAAVSAWEEIGVQRRNDHAYRLIAQWQGSNYTLGAGANDIGLYYTSLSAEALPGVHERYLNATWNASDWLNLTSTLRRTLRDQAALPDVNLAVGQQPTVTPVRVAANKNSEWRVDGTAIVKDVPGLQFNAGASHSSGELPGGASSDSTMFGLGVGYQLLGWGASARADRSKYTGGALVSQGDPLAFSTSTVQDSLNLTLTRSGMDLVAQAWSFVGTLSWNGVRLREQSGVGNSNNSTWAFTLSGRHVEWLDNGQLTLRYATNDTATNRMRTDGINLSADKVLMRHLNLRFYLDLQNTAYTVLPYSYRERTAGITLVYRP